MPSRPPMPILTVPSLKGPFLRLCVPPAGGSLVAASSADPRALLADVAVRVLRGAPGGVRRADDVPRRDAPVSCSRGVRFAKATTWARGVYYVWGWHLTGTFSVTSTVDHDKDNWSIYY
ncbi:hypothetical protein AcV5_000670 [Taiwanofungus camphoratus]|nr:hypothetical protein AcV5_000670 [Antrodia cinnamomea]